MLTVGGVLLVHMRVHIFSKAWDASLNKDVDDCVARHIATTGHLDRLHDLRFSRADVNLQTAAYTRVLEARQCPTSDRILQDMRGAIYNATEAIVDKQGRWSVGQARGAGHRALNRKGNWGGARVKNAAPRPDQWWYPGVNDIRKGRWKISEERYRRGQGQLDGSSW